jgi:hypothetical protein
MNATLRHQTIRWAIIAGVAFSTPLFVPRPKPGPASSNTSAQTPPFRVGETLNYRVDWQRYAGVVTVQLQIVDRGDFYGAPAWHFRAAVHTVQPIRAFYPMDDEIDSIALTPGLETGQYQQHYREFGKPEDTDAVLVSRGESPRAALPRVIVPPGTHDIVSALYFLRVTHWHTGEELRVPVYDGENVYEMVATARERTGMRVAAGTYQAREIEIRLLDGGKEISDGPNRLQIWLADDTAQTPLLCNADLSGTLRIELTSGTTLQAKNARTSITPRVRSNPQAGS